MNLKIIMKYAALCALTWSYSTSNVKTQIIENVALNKPTAQDGVLRYPTDQDVYWVSKNAVDGKKSCQATADYTSYSGTEQKSQPWWQVDLGDIYSIVNISVYGQPTDPPHQLNGFQVYLSLYNDTSSENHVYNNTEGYGSGVFTNVIRMGTKYNARYVTLVLPKSTFSGRLYNGPLVLCEVEVYGTAVSKVFNIAPMATISRSSVLSYGGHNYSAVNIKDQNKHSNPDTCDCCWSSDNEQNPWIQTVLPYPAPLVTIHIIGRTDAYKEGRERNLDGLQVSLDYVAVHNSRIMYNATTNSVTVYPQTQNVTTIKLTRLRPVCKYRSFGYNCSSTCHCRDNTSCEVVSGKCSTGLCDPGWQGLSCDKVCGYRSFGHNCSSTCHCRNNASCDAINGKCPSDLCEKGWQGSSCDKECGYRSFGLNCLSICHCRDNTSCGALFGKCSTGLCDPGWQGPSCDKECGYRSFGLNCSSICHCRDNTSCGAISGKCSTGLCDPGWQGPSCNKECGYRSFGLNCSSICHCRDNTSCVAISGKCSTGLCDQGWQSPSCDKECGFRSFGLNCSSICHCRDNTSCSAISEKCSTGLCDPGFQGPSCDKACDYRAFGDNCSSICHCRDNTSCDAVFGKCWKGFCDPGWQGSSCDRVCSYRSFGYNCSSICHCRDNTSCNAVLGNCSTSLCDPGWQGLSCAKECANGHFGRHCNSTCHCEGDAACDKVNGECLDTKCAGGWSGSSCQIQIQQALQQKPGNSTPVTVGVVGAAVGLLALGIVIGFVIYRRRRNANDSSSDQSQFSNLDKAVESKKSHTREQHRSSVYAQENRSFEEEDETGMNSSGAGDYYSFGDQFIGIRIHDLWDYIKEKMENQCEKLYSEFKTLPSGLVHPCKSADDIVNRGKNRYREMYAYDHSRVVLQDVENGKNTDYINACYINGYDKNKKFVASQGPTKQMINDFWRMVWQLKSDKIVMLTNLIELGTPKCLQYWPIEDEEEEHCFGNVTVKVLKTEKSLDYNIRYFEARKIGEPARRIRQFHFKSWPDKDVPDSSWCLVNFWRAVDTYAPSKAGPIVVHCSAGVGRTGTFIALDSLVSQAKTEGCVRPLQIVETLRRQRVNMVQTREQYVYLHEAVADALLFGTHIIWTKQFPEIFTFMLQKGKGETKTNLETQFELIERSTLDTTTEVADTTEYSNLETLQSESAAYRPKLKNMGSKFVQELGAIYIPNYKGKNTFLITMSPDKTTMEELWSLVDDNNIKTIIMLTETTAASYQSSCQLGSSGNNGNRFSVNKIEEKIRKGYTERTFTFKESDREDEEYFTTVKQFQCTTWNHGYTVPDDTRSLIDMVESVQKWQPHFSESQPVLIHCSNGYSRSGIVCMLLNELQRMKYEGGHINILESVKMMKKRQKYLIGTYEQYRFCFDLVLAHVKTTEVYENL